MEHCPSCSTQVPPGASACPQCGAALAPAGSPRKGLAIASLVLGILSLPTLGLLVVGGVAAIVLGAIAWHRAARRPLEYGGKGLAIGGLVCGVVSLVLIPVIGIFAAVAIPGLLRARQAGNEASAMGRLRTVLSAEMVYATVNGGAFDRLECLTGPSTCLPGYSGTEFLPPDQAEAERSGYRLQFFPGPPAVVDGTSIVSPSSLTAFAVMATPVTEAMGSRAFCIDDRGVLYQTDGAMPEPVDGRCDASGVPVP